MILSADKRTLLLLLLHASAVSQRLDELMLGQPPIASDSAPPLRIPVSRTGMVWDTCTIY